MLGNYTSMAKFNSMKSVTRRGSKTDSWFIFVLGKEIFTSDYQHIFGMSMVVAAVENDHTGNPLGTHYILLWICLKLHTHMDTLP